ncbi:heavy metal-associated domain-containing protein [Polyangium sp. 15x6]|uniref:heavy-metal-associated domain-containing protein n=1 Tax=Polyangium sp. 15x6 TaxID=3042687 RepID=UPI00249CAEF0|nr:heavy metal-associated domain-containing protein [Polyangium sp. 15x6]
MKRRPFGGWLLSLTRFAVKDHVKQRLGWSTSVRVTYGLERGRGASVPREALEGAVRGLPGVLTAELDERTLVLGVEYLPGTARPTQIHAAIERAGYEITTKPDLRRSKRDLVTGAERLDAITEAGARPPLTDAVTLHRLMTEVSAFMDTFPDPMRRAVRMWMEDEPFDAIAM